MYGELRRVVEGARELIIVIKQLSFDNFSRRQRHISEIKFKNYQHVNIFFVSLCFLSYFFA